MDPVSALGVAASVIACIQLTQSLLRRLGPSDHHAMDLHRMLRSMTSFLGAYEALKRISEVDDNKRDLSMTNYVDEPLRECKMVLEYIEDRLRNVNFIGQYVIGSTWDRRFKKCLARLDEAKELFELAVYADQQ